MLRAVTALLSKRVAVVLAGKIHWSINNCIHALPVTTLLLEITNKLGIPGGVSSWYF